jgi:hypothetical protein
MRAILRSSPTFLLYSLLPASLLLLGYLLQPFTAQASMKWVAAFSAAYLGLIGLTWLQRRFLLALLWENASHRRRMVWTAAAVLLGSLCFVLLTPGRAVVLEKLPIFAPQEQLEVRPALEAGESLTIQRIKIGLRQVPSASISLKGMWQSQGLLLYTSDPQARLTLTEHVPDGINLNLLCSPDAGRAVVSWAGRQEWIDLRCEVKKEAVYTFNFDRDGLPPATLGMRLLALPAWLGIAFAASGVLFVPGRRRLSKE